MHLFKLSLLFRSESHMCQNSHNESTNQGATVHKLKLPADGLSCFPPVRAASSQGVTLPLIDLLCRGPRAKPEMQTFVLEAAPLLWFQQLELASINISAQCQLLCEVFVFCWRSGSLSVGISHGKHGCKKLIILPSSKHHAHKNSSTCLEPTTAGD